MQANDPDKERIDRISRDVFFAKNLSEAEFFALTGRKKNDILDAYIELTKVEAAITLGRGTLDMVDDHTLLLQRIDVVSHYCAPRFG